MNIKENHFTPDHRDARKTVRLQPTAAQRRLWLVSGGDVRSATYNVPIALRLAGVLDRAALEEAVASLVERHPTLRARFRSEDDQLVVEAGESSLPVLRTLDLGHLPSDEQARMIAMHTQQEAEHLFDLAAGQPLRMMLLRLADDSHVLLMNLHHMVVDNWSLTLLLDEMSDTYRALRRGEALALGPVDYEADDLDELSDDDHVETLRTYWRDQLADAPHLHTIPTDRPRSREACNRGARLTFVLEPALLEGLHRVGRIAGTTPYMTGLAAFAALLHRYSSAQDVVIGSPFANRLTDAQQERIGFYSNLIPLRFRFDGAPSFMDLLAQARENVLDAFDHAELPFDEIVEVARPSRSSSHAPVFQVMFDMVGGSLQTFSLDGLSVDATLLDSGTSKYDLNLELVETAERLSGTLEYDTDLFDAGTAERFAGHFERMLDSVLRTPDAPIAQATLLSPQELDQVLRFAKPARPLGATPFVSIPQRISQQARNTPNATALVYLDERLTYRQLDQRVEQLAHRLRAQGIEKGQRVATFIAYSPENVIAFLAIQRVGAVFLPLGPADRRFPEKLEDSQPALIVSRSQDAGGLNGQTTCPVLFVDDVAQTPATQTASALATLDETDPAYVIYTSGSTGKPKGVEVNHGSLHASFFGWCDAYRFGQPGRPVALQLAGPTFDLYIGDLARTLSLGGCLVLCPREWLLEAGQLYRLIADEKVTFGDFPPVVLRQLIRYCNETGRRLDGFETLVCGADVWFGHELQAAQALCAPHARVLGSYGVTEAAIDSSAFDPAEHALAPTSVVPIGRPLSSCELYVVDALLQLVPIGLPGELLIAGTPVATGYLNRPELNAEKFLSGSFDANGRFVAGSGTGTTRSYRSGDICRMLADGTIEFLGRRDNQVKIRGFRVELGEIESVLAEHPEVEQSAVIAHGAHSDDLVLIGYAVSATPVEALLDYLRSRLPAHMVPVALERLPELPLTPSGKIDRKRLPIPDFSTVQASHTAPRNPAESRMLALWQTVLSTASPGVHDNFFHCGGHSLAAARLVAQINRAFGTRWNMSVVFDRPTIAELADLAVGEMLAAHEAGQHAVDERTGNTTGNPADIAAPLARPSDPSLLSFGQRSLWFVAMGRRGASDYNLPDALQLNGPLDCLALTQALNDVLARHAILRTTFSATVREVRDAQGAAGYEPSLSVHDEMHVELVVIDAFGADLAERIRLLHTEAARGFDLSQGPLMYATLFAFGPHEHVLCVTFHHIAVDGQSITVFWHDLERCYNARARGAVPTLAPLKAHYANFIAWQRSFVDSPEFLRQMQFWRQRLDALPAPLPLAASAPQAASAAISPTAPASVLFPLGDELAAAVDPLCRATNCTPFIAYCALFALLLHRESGQSDIITGIPSSTRSDEAYDDVIGFFVNTLPLRIGFDEIHTFRDLLLRVRQASLDVYAHRDVPFEVLVQTLNPPRAPGRNPIFQTSFTCDLDDATPPRLKDLLATRVAVDTDNAKLDLDMSIEKIGGAVFGRLMSRHPALDTAALGRMQAHFVALTRAVLATPDATWDMLVLDAAPVLTSSHHAQDPQTLTALIDRTIAAHPARTALELEDTATTYRELDTLATALAGTLADLGIGLGARVGIFTGSHPHMVTAMLGILRAGAVFVPLDPAQRDQGWNEHVVTDAALVAIVCREGVAHDAARLGPPVVNLDRIDSQTIRTSRRVVPVQSDDCACVIYTSGSTGVPKGAVLSHRNLVSTVPGITEAMRVTPTSRTAQFFAPSFDGVLAEALPALLSGGAVIFGSRTQLLPGPGMVDWLAQKRITHLAIVPSALGLMPAASLPDLQVITVAGEACPLETARRWAPGRRLLNGYGPTECAICISMCEYWEEGEKMALRPLDGLRFHVLDEALNEVAIGESGELFCGGPCVGYGYLGLPARTAQGFVADRFATQAGGRLYRTGDTVRRLADGRVEFVGRADRQVKIRGNRIELDAVAAELNAIDGVQQAAALARIDQQGQKELVAYVVARCSKAELLAALRAKVPPAMVPSSLTFLEQMPLGRTGKIDMKALAALRPSQADDHAALPTTSAQSIAPSRAMRSAKPTRLTTIERVAALWCDLLERRDIDHDENFFDAGGHSLRAVALHQRLIDAFGPVVTLTDLFVYPTIRTLAEQIDIVAPPELRESVEVPADDIGDGLSVPTDAATPVDQHAIAIIGMTGRFPSAPDLASFWQGLLDGYEGGTYLSDDELRARGVDAALLRNPNYVRHVSLLDGATDFDAAFFGLAPREAQLMDPQQRLFLEMASEVLEQAGYGSDQTPRSVGVFASCSFSHYMIENIVPNMTRLNLDSSHLLLGNDKDFLSTRTAYKLNLHGPAISLGTACSSSLVAVHQACASLLADEAEMALAGAVSLDPDRIGYVYAEGGIMSADGHCRPFDATAGGTSNGSGGGVVLLKRLSVALRDGDTVHAVIRGSAINNDGGSKVSYTAPSMAGQAAVIRNALRAAGVDASSIDYIEAHGTGTRLGDPIEVRALTQAFNELSGDTPLPAQSCAIGSVKGNIGHLDAAAGMAGLIKTVLSLKHRTLPPSINCTTPNPEIRFEQTPFEVVREARPWPKRATSPRRAGVSAFGVGGTNAHVIVEEAPVSRDERRSDDDHYQLVPLSAKTPAALEQQAQRLAAHLAAQSGPARLRDVAYTMQVGRSAFRHRAFAVGNTTDTLVAHLQQATHGAVPAARGTPAVVFMFPGQGSQYVGMGAQLYRAGGVFRETVDRCADGFARYVERDLRDFLLGPADDLALQQELNETRFTQPALFTVEYALACQLQDYGIAPKAMIGHSLGELVGACVAGLIGLDDALTLVARRAAVMQRQPAGAMLAVNAQAHQLDALLAVGCEIAAMNGAQQYVLAGSLASIPAAEQICARNGIACQRLATSHAFHSSSMDQAVAPINLASPTMLEGNGIRLISNRSGRWLDERDRDDAGYWGEHIRRPVQFHRGIDTLLAAFDRPVLLEVGPGRALGSMLRDHADLEPTQLLTTLRHPREQKADHEVLLKSIGTLWTRGVAIDWARLHAGHEPKRTTLPTYPFERSRHWLERPTGGSMYSAPRAAGIAFEQQRTADGATAMRFELNDRHWFVDEHRIFEGNAVLPGTGCLDLVQLAFTAWRPAAATTLADVYFPAALILPRNARCEGRVVFTPRSDTLTFVLESRPYGTDDDWILHATGQVSPDAVEASAVGSLDDLRERFAMKPLQGARAQFDQAFAEYGSRWHSMESVWLGERCGLARLRLADSLSGDLGEHTLHPALLDLATAFLSVCTRPDTAAIPFHYREVKVYAPLRAECYSLVCETSPGHYDVTLLAADNRSDTPTVLAEIRGFSLRAMRAPRRDPDAPDGERVSDWCRTLRWVDEPLIVSAQATEPWLVFGDAQGSLRSLIDDAPPGSIVVTADHAFRTLGERHIGLRQGSRDDYRQLIDLLGREQRRPSRIVYGWTASDAVASFDQLGQLVQALGVQNAPVTLSVVTHGWCSAETEAACDAATAVGLLQAVNWEFPKVVCRHIDIDDDMLATRTALLAELVTTPSPTAQATVTTVSLANGQRRVPRYVRLPSVANKDVLRDRGVYLITGGLTGIGYEVARHIATTKSDVKLGLVSRSGLGDVREDVNLISRNSAAERRARIEELERAGAEVLVLQADIGDPQQTSHVVDTLRHRFGPINGVVHSAGIEASGLLESGAPQAWQRVLGPKVSGTRQLCEQVREDRPDFVLLCSSLASLIGGLGQADYSAGNAYIDTVARYWRGQGLPVIAVNWDAWSETGMALDYATRTSQGSPASIRGLTNREGCDIFALAAASAEAQIAVSKYGSIERLIERELATRTARRAAPVQSGSADSVRDFLLDLWREMLGVEAFRDDDDFFELGGHSLLATQLISRVRDRYERCLTLAEFLDTPTLARIARSIDAAPASSGNVSRDDVQRVILALWQELLGVEKIASDDDFFELGGHSLLATQLISRVRDQYDRCLTLAEFLDTPTVARIVASIDVHPTSRATSASSDPAVRYCIVPLNNAGTLPPFFGVPGMGGNVAQLLPLSAALGNERPFIGLQCLGLDGIAQPHTSVEQMAEHYIACLRSIQPAGPYYLGGHSLGGKVAYEMARQLHDAGEEIGLLALFDSAAPPYTTTTRIDDCVVTEVILSIFAYYTGKPQILAGATAEQLRELTLEQQLAVIQQRLERFGVVRAQTDGGAIRGLFNVYRAAADLGPKYDPVQRPLPLPILLFKAREPMPEGMNLPEARDTDGWGWERLTRHAVRSVEVPGNHFSCLMPEQVEHLAAPLRAALDAASQRRFA